MLTVRQLKEFLADVSDDTEVVTGDYRELHYGELYKDQIDYDPLVVIG
jgi:hypothetical protein